MTTADGHLLRGARPEDYDAIAAVADLWWGRPIVGSLPRLFLDHFHRTSLVAEAPEGLVGFLVGLISPSAAGVGYIHFVGVAPAARNRGLARTLYDAFFALAAGHGVHRVKAITSPVNQGSVAFHRRMGFSVRGPVPDYDGPGRDMMVFERAVAPGGAGRDTSGAVP